MEVNLNNAPWKRDGQTIVDKFGELVAVVKVDRYDTDVVCNAIAILPELTDFLRQVVLGKTNEDRAKEIFAKLFK